MQQVLITVISFHVLAGAFWAGTTFALARTGGIGVERLFRPQMAAAFIAIVTGGYLWNLLHKGGFGPAEQFLTIGAGSAIGALAVQALMIGPATRKLRTAGAAVESARSPVVIGYRIAAVLLAVATLSMAAARYA